MNFIMIGLLLIERHWTDSVFVWTCILFLLTSASSANNNKSRPRNNILKCNNNNFITICSARGVVWWEYIAELIWCLTIESPKESITTPLRPNLPATSSLLSHPVLASSSLEMHVFTILNGSTTTVHRYTLIAYLSACYLLMYRVSQKK